MRSDQIGERWLPVPGYEGHYEVSDRGGIRSLDRRGVDGRRLAGKRMRPWRSPQTGRDFVSLFRDGERKLFLVYRLVLLAFVGQPRARQICCHNNGDPTDNRLENLHWGTYGDNSRDALEHGAILVGERHPRAKLTDAQSREIYELADTGVSPTAVAREYGVTQSTISAIWAGGIRSRVNHDLIEARRAREEAE